MAVNLLAALDEERYGASALARAHEGAARAGCALRRVDGTDERLAAWIDLHFAPSWWSFEAGAGSAWIAERDGEIAGFAAFGARGLKFPWLRAWRDRGDRASSDRTASRKRSAARGIGEALLTAALCALRATGFAFALIPAVAGERLIAAYVRRTGAAVADEFDYDVGRFRATILASGAGTNARNVLERARDGRLPLDVGCRRRERSSCGCARRGARARRRRRRRCVGPRARDAGELRRARHRSRRAHRAGSRAAARLDASAAAGVHAALPGDDQPASVVPAAGSGGDSVVAPDGTVIPALRGAHALRDAVRANVPWTGVTVHYVTEAADRGAVLVRIPVPVSGATNEATLRERLRPIEFAAVAAAIRRWAFER